MSESILIDTQIVRELADAFIVLAEDAHHEWGHLLDWNQCKAAGCKDNRHIVGRVLIELQRKGRLRQFPADVMKNVKSVGAQGGLARAKALSPERRKEIAQQAALARWRKPNA